MGIIGAPTASAADRSGLCEFIDGVSGIVAAGTFAVVDDLGPGLTAGELIGVTATLISDSPRVVLYVPIEGAPRSFGSAPITLTYTAVGGETSVAVNNGGDGSFSFVFSCTAAPDPVPAWVQAYGRASADATCIDGWDASWQSWAEPVTGGWVCTRSIPSYGQPTGRTAAASALRGW